MFIMENEYIIRRQRYDDVGRSFTCGDVDLDDSFKNDFLRKNGFIPINDIINSRKCTVPMYFDLADLDIE